MRLTYWKNSGFRKEADAELDDLLLAVYAAHAKKLIDTGQFEEAKKLLYRALNISRQRTFEQAIRSSGNVR